MITLVRMIKEGRKDALVAYAVNLMEDVDYKEVALKLLLFIFLQDKNVLARTTLEKLGYLDQHIVQIEEKELSKDLSEQDLFELGVSIDGAGLVHFKKDSYAYQQFIFEEVEGGFALTGTLSPLKIKQLRLPDFIDDQPIVIIRESFFDKVNISQLICPKLVESIDLRRGKNRNNLGIVKNLHLAKHIQEITLASWSFRNYVVEKISFEGEFFDINSIFTDGGHLLNLEIDFNVSISPSFLSFFIDYDMAKQKALKSRIINQINNTQKEKKLNPLEPMNINAVLSSLISYLNASKTNENYIDATFSEDYLIIDDNLPNLDVKLLQSLREKPQDFRLLPKDLKEDYEFIKLCSILIPSAFYHFSKKFKDSIIIMRHIVPLSYSMSNFERSSILEDSEISPLIELFHYDPLSRANNYFEFEYRDYKKNSKLYWGDEKFDEVKISDYRNMILHSIDENPIMYFAFNHYKESYLKQIIDDSFKEEMKETYLHSKEKIFYSLKCEVGFDFYNFVGRKKQIKDFKKNLLTQTKTKTFGEALSRLEDENQLQELVVKCELSHDLEIVPLMYLQEQIIPHSNLLPFMKQAITNKVMVFFQKKEKIRHLLDWDVVYALTLEYISENFEDVMNQKVLVPLHQLNLLEKPKFEISSLYMA